MAVDTVCTRHQLFRASCRGERKEVSDLLASYRSSRLATHIGKGLVAHSRRAKRDTSHIC